MATRRSKILALGIASIPLLLLASWTWAIRDIPEAKGYRDGEHWFVLAGGIWHIEPSLVHSIRTQLPAFAHAKSTSREEEESAKHISSYYVQLLAMRVGNQRKVLVYGSCFGSGGDLTEAPVRAIGGGSCFFQAWFDPDANRFDSFYFNSILG